jgi:hypothetical protein
MAPSRGDVLLGRVIDADAKHPQDADGRPCVRPDQRTKQAGRPEQRECASKLGSRLLGRELNGLDRHATAADG